MEANGRWRDERCSLQPTLLSAPSCKAGVYARCWLKTVEMGDERPLPELCVVRGPTSRGINLPLLGDQLNFF